MTSNSLKLLALVYFFIVIGLPIAIDPVRVSPTAVNSNLKTQQKIVSKQGSSSGGQLSANLAAQSQVNAQSSSQQDEQQSKDEQNSSDDGNEEESSSDQQSSDGNRDEERNRDQKTNFIGQDLSGFGIAQPFPPLIVLPNTDYYQKYDVNALTKEQQQIDTFIRENSDVSPQAKLTDAKGKNGEYEYSYKYSDNVTNTTWIIQVLRETEPGSKFPSQPKIVGKLKTEDTSFSGGKSTEVSQQYGMDLDKEEDNGKAQVKEFLNFLVDLIFSPENQ